MSTNYTFNVTQLEIAPTGSDGHTDVVTRVRYNYIGVDTDGYSGSFAGATPMPTPADTGSFVPFSQLTEADVVDWLEAVSDKGHMQYMIQKQIANQKEPQSVPAPLPWGGNEPTGSTTGSI